MRMLKTKAPNMLSYNKTSGKPWKNQVGFNSSINTLEEVGLEFGPALPEPRSNFSVAVTKNRVYVIGGLNNAIEPVNTVYVSKINSEGILTEWQECDPIPCPLYDAQVALVKDKLYLLGGGSVDDVVKTVYRTTVDSEGFIGPWVEDTPLPYPGIFKICEITKHVITLTGGRSLESKTLNNMSFFSNIENDGTLGNWHILKHNIPDLGNFSVSIQNHSEVSHVLSGNDGYKEVSGYYYEKGNIIKDWKKTSYNINDVNKLYNAITTTGTVYLIGVDERRGFTGIYEGDVYRDGHIAQEFNLVLKLPIAVKYPEVLVTSSRMYILGGIVSTTVTDEVYSIPFMGGMDNYLEQQWSNTHV